MTDIRKKSNNKQDDTFNGKKKVRQSVKKRYSCQMDVDHVLRIGHRDSPLPAPDL